MLDTVNGADLTVYAVWVPILRTDMRLTVSRATTRLLPIGREVCAAKTLDSIHSTTAPRNTMLRATLSPGAIRWRDHVRILELLNEIRAARARRTAAEKPERPR